MLVDHLSDDSISLGVALHHELSLQLLASLLSVYLFLPRASFGFLLSPLLSECCGCIRVSVVTGHLQHP